MLDDALQQAKTGLGNQVKQQILGPKKEPKKSVGLLKQINPFEKKENEGRSEAPSAVTSGEAQKKADQDLVSGLYGVEPPPPPEPVVLPEDKNKPQSKETKQILKNNQNKSPEELEKIFALRNTLHQQQVGDLFRPAPERPEEEQQKQETAADRMARMQQEDLQEKQKKEEKKKPIAVTNAETARERRPGAG